MKKKSGKKVAYVVLRGHTPGVYGTWQEAADQTNGYSLADHRGYTQSQGGWEQACRDFESHVKSKGIAQKGVSSKKKKKNQRPASWDEPADRCWKQPRRDVSIHASSVPRLHKFDKPPSAPRSPPSVLAASTLFGGHEEIAVEAARDGISKSGRDSRGLDSPSPRAISTDPSPNYEKSTQELSADTSSETSDSSFRSAMSVIVSGRGNVGDAKIYGSFGTTNGGEDADSDSTDYGDFPTNLLPQPKLSFTNDEPILSSEQQRVVDLALSGSNIFFTGSAGTGKSTTMRHLIQVLKAKRKHTDVLAPTGRAALAIGGTTDFVYAGWVPDSKRRPLKDLMARACGKCVWKRLSKTEILIIDEISMIENFRFRRLDQVMRAARGRWDEPFGGVQLIVSGDFCQLPPVKPFETCIICGKETKPLRASYRCLNCNEFYDESDRWAFASGVWDDCSFQHISLSQIFRQSDRDFIDILEKYRLGDELNVEEKLLLLDHECDVEDAVQLLPRRHDVSQINTDNFMTLKEPILHYQAFDNFECRHEELTPKLERHPNGSLRALAEHSLEYELDLRIDTIVVLTANLSIQAGLVNGSQGKVVGFHDIDPMRMPELRGEYAGWQQHYIGGFVQGLAANAKKLPVVQFTNGHEAIIHPVCRINELGDEEPWSLISRTQIPLLHAWALTIHKAQGMTLDRVIVNLANAFEEGQVYVALSRARSLAGLKVEALEVQQFRGNPEVKDFLKARFGTPYSND